MEQQRRNNLGSRVANSVAWISGARILARAIGTIRLLVVAAILPLDQIGLFGLAAIAISLIEALSQTGMAKALIQREGDVRPYLDTAWTTHVVRGAAIGLGIYLTADYIAIFFEKPAVAPLLQNLSIVPFLLGTKNLGLVLLEKELRFGKVVTIDICTSIVDLLICVLVAFQSPNAMALVWGRVFSALFASIASFAIERRWPKLNFVAKQFRELYAFGFWVFVSVVLSFLLIRGSDIVIGKLLPAADLAVYQIAYALACIPTVEIMSVFSATALPAYSQIQDNPVRLRSAFLRVLVTTSYLSAFALAGFALFSTDVTKLFLKPAYAPVAFLLPPLAVWGVCRGLGATNSTIFQAIGRPALATVFQFFMLVLFAVVLVPCAYRFGLEGIAFSLAGIGFSAQVFRYLLVVYVLKVPAMAIFRRLTIPLLVGLVAALFCWGCLYTLGLAIPMLRHPAGRLTAGTGLLTLFYFTGAYWSDERFHFGLTPFIQSHFMQFLPQGIGKA